MISIDVVEKPDPQWNERLKNSPDGTIYQTKEYGSYLQSRLKAKPIYLKFYEKDEIVSQLLIFQTHKGSKKISKWFGRGLIYSFAVRSSLLPKYIFWIFGPVIFNKHYQKENFMFIKSEEFNKNTSLVYNEVLKFLRLHPFELKKYEKIRKREYEKMNPDTRKKLTEYFNPHNQRLSKLLEMEFDWDNKYEAY